jgi:hypothetical protein
VVKINNKETEQISKTPTNKKEEIQTIVGKKSVIDEALPIPFKIRLNFPVTMGVEEGEQPQTQPQQ